MGTDTRVRSLQPRRTVGGRAVGGPLGVEHEVGAQHVFVQPCGRLAQVDAGELALGRSSSREGSDTAASR